jgi:hypothetical protein
VPLVRVIDKSQKLGVLMLFNISCFLFSGNNLKLEVDFDNKSINHVLWSVIFQKNVSSCKGTNSFKQTGQEKVSFCVAIDLVTVINSLQLLQYHP